MLKLREALLFLLFLLPYSEGIAFPGPVPTTVPLADGQVLQVDLKNHYLTRQGAQSPEITEAPHVYLKRRQRSATSSSPLTLGYGSPDEICGYVDGILGIPPKSCPGFSTCVAIWDPTFTDPGYLGCCEEGRNGRNGRRCNFITGCADSTNIVDTSTSRGDCDARCQQNTLITKCTNEDMPWCMVYTLADFSGAPFFECTNTSYEYVTAISTDFGGGDRLWTPIMNTTSPPSGPTFKIPGSTGTGTLNEATETTKATETPTLIPGGSGNGGSKTPVGAIVGGVVGGILGLALVGCLIFFIHRQTSRKNNNGPNGQIYYDGQPHPPPPISSPPPFGYAGYEQKSQSEHYDTVRSMSQSSTAASPVTETPGIHQTFYTGHPSVHVNPGTSQEMPTASQNTQAVPSSPAAPTSAGTAHT